MVLLTHLSDGLAAVRVDPEGSRLDHFLWIYLGDGPLHLIYQSPTGCVAQTHTHASEFIVLIVEQTGERGGHGHTSTFHVLSLSRCLSEAQEETQSHTRREH